MRLREGDPAPNFSADAVEPNGDSVKHISFHELRGKKIVLVFYPKDNTPGCTMQACAIRDHWRELKDKAVIFGVSADDEQSHRKFISKRKLPYPLLVDKDHAIAEAYGTWTEKSLFGKKYMGVERSTFIIDEEGNLEKIFHRVNPIKHNRLLLEALA